MKNGKKMSKFHYERMNITMYQYAILLFTSLMMMGTKNLTRTEQSKSLI
jgi:hypothetical protein